MLTPVLEEGRLRARGRYPRRAGLLACLLAPIALAAGMPAAHAQDPSAIDPDTVDPRRALHVEAAYLVNFLRYTDWPAPARADAPLVISVVGADRVSETVAAVAAVAGPVHGRSIVVRDVAYRWQRTGASPARLQALEQLRGSHLVFIDASAGRSAPRVVQDLVGHPVLTVSNVAGFVDAGGMIELIRQGRNIVFAANPGAVSAAGVALSARVLTLARQAGAEGR